MQFEYAAIVGSTAFGLNLPTSDVDIVYINSVPKECVHEHAHYMPRTPDNLIMALTLQTIHPESLEWIFPAKSYGNAELTKYIKDNRDSLAYQCRDWVWEHLWSNACNLSLQADYYYHVFPKRMAYSIMRFNTLFRYASGDDFENAFRPDNDLRELLISVRKCEIPVRDVIAIDREIKQKALSKREFYTCTENLQIRKKMSLELKQLIVE